MPGIWHAAPLLIIFVLLYILYTPSKFQNLNIQSQICICCYITDSRTQTVGRPTMKRRFVTSYN